MPAPDAHAADTLRGDPLPWAAADTAPTAQWGEAYQLFDGEYRSLDELLRTLPE